MGKTSYFEEEWIEKLHNKKHIYITHRHRQQCGDSQRERGVGVGGGGQRRVNRDEKGLCLG